MTASANPDPYGDRIRDIQSLTDAELSRLDDHDFLAELMVRTRAVLKADTAAALLMDYSSGHLVAAAAAGLEEEVRQGVRIPVGRGFAGRIAAEHKPVILDRVDHTTVLNPLPAGQGDHVPHGGAHGGGRPGDRRAARRVAVKPAVHRRGRRAASARRRPGGGGSSVDAEPR
jgi:hypothetical protein